MNTNRKNKQWLRNRDQLKSPKIFSLTAIRNPDGSFHLIGGQQKVMIRKNQFMGEWINVDTRDIACELRNSKITTF
jgi:hypothetical protein